MANYEYFRRGVVLTGKHAMFVDDMWQQNDIQNSFFKRLVDLYTIAPVIGLRMKRKVAADTSTDNKRTVQLEQIMTRREDLLTIMNLVLLLDDDNNLSVEEKVDRTFRGPENEEQFHEYEELFEAYCRGGIEILHEQLIDRPLTIEDAYSDRKIGNIMALLDNPLVPDMV
ncbi:hypothetical protein [Pseudobutyrivibrio xylanivorans]|uniref:Uncharacterized protein n=1 Tax=Pseudobutyrivibrio xylanivorans DSM 14809 TaxID=1123012 RepID=A0A1M6JW37_PSEXY|nr:hypothetical protein [Pseudobutyrivibrio xylanivorans]SHJ50907.1 hypothetical protein SAMN02745725_02704 [Pseudobutyrivibrio xylanivorans DSM 14809]